MSLITTADPTPVEPIDSHFFHPWAELDVPSNQLYIYKEDDYSGDQWNLQFDMSDKERAYYFQLKGTGFNDEVSSWKLGRNIWAEFCKDDLEWDETATEENPRFTCPGGAVTETTTTVDWYDHANFAEEIGSVDGRNETFDDLEWLKEQYAADEVPVLSGMLLYDDTNGWVHGIQAHYKDRLDAPLHTSSSAASSTEHTLEDGEKIIKIETMQGAWMDGIRFTTNLGNVIETGGFGGGNPYSWEAPDGCYVIGFAGITDWVLGNFKARYICEDDITTTTTVTVGTPGTRSAGSAAGEAAVSSWQPNDEVSGVILRLYDAATNPAATVYTGLGCTGRSAALFTNALQPKSYSQEALSDFGLPDGSVASFMAPVGVWVHAFDDGAMSGGDFKNEKFPGQEDKDGWMVCQNFDADWQATISSIQISWEVPAPVRGKWIMIGEGEHTHKYYSGFFTAEGDKPATVSQGDLLASFEVGLEFINRHCSVHQLVTDEIRQQTYLEMSAAFEKTEVQTGLCPPRLPLDGKIGYFVYVVETQDGDASIINAKGVCRYGDDWDVAPLCPPAACLDEECNECANWY